MRVILKRGIKGDIAFDHATKKQAWSRAFHLAELHSADVVEVGEAIVIDASTYYNKVRVQ